VTISRVRIVEVKSVRVWIVSVRIVTMKIVLPIYPYTWRREKKNTYLINRVTEKIIYGQIRVIRYNENFYL